MNRTIVKPLIIITLSLLLSTQTCAQNKRKRTQISRVVAEAQTYLGVPYRYGGTSKKGIDCSGLILRCYEKIDIKLPRTAEEQSKLGKGKSWGTIRPGDIVYFKFKEKRDKWYHSGMITSTDGGDIRFIHASSSRGVVESSLNLEYYRKNVKKFRRVIK